jgi:monovalent cation/hydrogen antiporter
MADSPCGHFAAATHLTTTEHVCKDCVAMNSNWVHLRLCLICGYVGCCDSSPNRHASTHARTTGDPVVRSIEPGEAWGYCFVDDITIEDVRQI